MQTALESEAKRLYDLIQQEIDNYYSSYTPKAYKRTNRFKKSLRIKVDKRNGSFIIYFEDGLAYHPSIMSKKSKRFVPTLIDSGWKWDNDKQHIYRFTYYDGYHFIEKAIRRFYQTNPTGYKISIKIQSKYNSEYYKNL